MIQMSKFFLFHFGLILSRYGSVLQVQKGG